ncbi:MAG: glycosyltransferase [Bacteroides sp.]|nr:glycosyltransferase [Bacteroides sp.]MCM1447744.1 glycosyltransferase [Bacteroides sp.]
MTLISVIIPIYKVERFIKRCAKSLLEQTLQEEVEFIFVDDCTPDRSISLLEETISCYPHRSADCHIVRHKVNKGLPAARNTGLIHAKGKYIYHCDSDDWLELDALEKLLNMAESKQADMVWCDWYLSFKHNERYMKQPDCHSSEEALQKILRGKMKYNVWNKLTRRSLYKDNQITFPTRHGMGEDMTMIRLLACASVVAYVPSALYHYVKTNGEAFTNSFSEKNLCDIIYNTNETIRFLSKKKGSKMDEAIACFKLSVKYPLLISDDKRLYAIWQTWFPEANTSIWRNEEFSFRSRFLQYVASKNMFWIVRLHYQWVYRLIYGLIYR